MAELHLKRTDDTLTVTFGEHNTSVPWADVALKKDTGQRIYDDAGKYGRTLFGQVFRDESVRSALLALRSNERLMLVAEQPEVAAIPWEYLRDSNNTLLASRLNLVRGVPEGQRRGEVSLKGPVKIVAVPVSPVDESSILNTEREWRWLVERVTGKTPEEAPNKVLTLTRVRPPTLTQMEQTLPGQGISIISFMGHSGRHKDKSVLVFEDQLGRSQPIDAAYFADALDESVFLVVLNSCLSAVGTATEFGNIAQALVHQGVPYALGMQFVLLDDAALEMSKTLYTFLLSGRNVEEAVRRTRRMLENNTALHHPLWVAGIPVLHTNLREPAPPIVLETGQPTIQPNPERLQTTCDI